MMNPRVVKPRSGSGMVLAIRGHAADAEFVLGVDGDAIQHYRAFQVEDALLIEAGALIKRAAAHGVDWGSLGFVRREDFDVWERLLTARDLDQLMGPSDASPAEA